MTSGRLVLHIGSHKTGTTYLQSVLQGSVQQLQKHGIDYPEVGRDLDVSRRSPGHRFFPAFFRGQVNEHPLDFSSSMHAFQDSEWPVSVISAEDFWFCSLPKTVRRVGDFFGVDATVVCYLRHPSTHLYSLYGEHLKGRRTETFAEFLAGHAAGLDRNAAQGVPFYAYDRNIAAWRTVFSDIRLVPYKRASSDVAFVQRFLNEAELSVPATELNYDGIANTSMPPGAVSLLRQANVWLEKGSINRAQHKTIRRVLETAAADVLSAVGGAILTEKLDLRPFLKVFKEANPSTSRLFDASDTAPEELVLPTGVSMPDKALLELMVGFAG